MKFVINSKYSNKQIEMEQFITNFDSTGDLFVAGSRNTIKIFQSTLGELNIKSFKKPHLINSFVYKFFRDSKAKRSFYFAQRLLDKNIGTPEPIGFSEFNSGIGLGRSFYICAHIHAKYTFRDLVEIPDLEDHENILRAFTRFCFRLHQEGVEFKDHSPGNTLINPTKTSCDFYLVDLNRMQFHQFMSFEQRMFNLRRLTPKKEMVAVMANEYAKFYKEKQEKQIFELLWNYTSDFQKKFHQKQRLKKRLKFWKK